MSVKKNIYLQYALIVFFVVLLTSLWEFWLEEQVVCLFGVFDEPESFGEKLEYVVTVAVFCLLAIVVPLRLAIRAENRRVVFEREREKLLAELQAAVSEIKTLRGIIPICSYCKQIRTDRGIWQELEAYIRDRSDAEFSHGLCPECFNKKMVEIGER